MLNITSRILNKNKKFVRFRHAADHWSVLTKKNKPIDKALAHFDEFYPQIFGVKWDAMREALLGKQKYVAIINNYSDSDEIMAKLELTGALNVRTLCNIEKQLIREELQSNKRRQLLKQIRKLDRILDQKANEQVVEDKKPDAHLSLQASLDDAEIDYRRLIDGNATEVLNEFVPATKIKGKDDFISETTHYDFLEDPKKFNVQVEREYELHFPEYLNVYCYEEENYSGFEPAKIGSTGVLGYYLMDGASILPVLALGIRPGDRILDMCAGPGGKTLLAIQTLYPEVVVSNDVSKSRTNRIYNVCKQFLYDLDERWIDTGRLKISVRDGRYIKDDNFDRILVDVPCTTDRHSLVENDNNIFKPSRVKERLKLPEVQAELLFSALKLVKKGGTVVYSTCSLSPIQNDGVVHMALKQLWEQTKINVIVKDLSFPILQTRNVFKFASTKVMKYGQLVVPHLTQNYGPMYFCKLQRIS